MGYMGGNPFGMGQQAPPAPIMPQFMMPQFNTSMMQNFMQSMNIPGFLGTKKNIQPSGADPSLVPNKTLYVNNLDDKIKPDQLKKELKAMFSNFGEVISIIAMKSFWRRGQAWVIFSDQDSATKALKGLQGFPYNNKPMRVNYAKAKSDVFTKEDGTFEERPKGPRKPRAIIEREQQLQTRLSQMHQQMSEQNSSGNQQAASPSNTASVSTPPPPKEPATVTAAQPEDKAAIVAALTARAADAMNARKRAGDFPTPTQQAQKVASFQSPQQALNLSFADLLQPSHALPNRTLFISDLPENITDVSMLDIFFRQHEGFQEIRLIPARNVAFVDYENEAQAGFAMAALQGSLFENSPLKISYAKR